MIDKKTLFDSRELQLSMDIASCSGVSDALTDPKHPCLKIVRLQSGDTSGDSDRQRPEPWIGNLKDSLVLFISSNPSINDDQKPFGENFPTYQWSVEESGEFFVHRIGNTSDPMNVTFNHSTKPNFITRAIDGEYRNGLTHPNTPQRTWSRLHQRALELLGFEADPSRNYAITEIVHCKSRSEVGVKESSTFCSERWMSRILTISPARILIIVGGQVRDRYAEPILSLAPDFGSGANYIEMTQKERSVRDIKLNEFGGSRRLVIFNYHPSSREHKYPQRLEVIFGSKVVTWLRRIALGDLPIPENQTDLLRSLEGLFEK